MEEQIFTSGIDFTILQPCAYMQNILGIGNLSATRNLRSSIRTSAKFSIVDLQDVAQVAAKVLMQDESPKCNLRTCLVPIALAQDEVAEILSTQFGKQ